MNVTVREPRVPTLLRATATFFQTQPAPAPPDAGTFAAAAVDDGAKRIKVLVNLISKYLKLDDTGAALQLAMSATDDPARYDDAALQLAEVRGEQSLCKARYDAVDADQPFKDPGPVAEQALLAAIADVDRARANTNAIQALIGAAHGLVVAYLAEDTKP